MYRKCTGFLFLPCIILALRLLQFLDVCEAGGAPLVRRGRGGRKKIVASKEKKVEEQQQLYTSDTLSEFQWSTRDTGLNLEKDFDEDTPHPNYDSSTRSSGGEDIEDTTNNQHEEDSAARGENTNQKDDESSIQDTFIGDFSLVKPDQREKEERFPFTTTPSVVGVFHHGYQQEESSSEFLEKMQSETPFEETSVSDWELNLAGKEEEDDVSEASVRKNLTGQLLVSQVFSSSYVQHFFSFHLTSITIFIDH